MDVRLPNLGEGADSGTVVAILVKEGEELKKGQTILELENEKAVAAIPSPADGKVTRVLVKVGDKISVGQPLLSVEGGSAPAEEKKASPASKAAPATVRPAKAAPKTPAPVAAEPEAESEEFDEEEEAVPEGTPPPPASPSVRRTARELGINLYKIQGSEAAGRIVMGDLRDYIARLRQAARSATKKAAATPPPEKPDFGRFGSILKKPMSSLRQTISRRMVESITTIPQVTQFDEADITALMQLRSRYVAKYDEKKSRLTLTVFALKAAAATLKKHLIFNSSLDESAQEIVLKEYIHIGLAVDTEAGLMVPVIRDADKKSMVDLAAELNTLAEKTRDRKLSMEDMRGGSFTISNQGGIGGAHFTPIINKPEVAILGMGKGLLKPMVRNKTQIEPRLMLPLCLSYDHRVVDGGQAARFMTDLVAEFENFSEDLVKI